MERCWALLLCEWRQSLIGLETAADNTFSVESFPYTVPKFIRESKRAMAFLEPRR
jgi:hypothetical protein